MEIKLEDEIINEKNKKNTKLKNTNLSSIELKKINYLGKKNKNNKKTVTFSSIEDKKKNTEIKKLNIKKYKESKYKKRNNSEGNVKYNEKNNSNNNSSNHKGNNILIIDELNNYSKESNFFYKFILDNANDADDVFQKKLDYLIKTIENKKKEKEKKEKKEKNLVKDKKKFNNEDNETPRSNSAKNIKKNRNIFIYSETAKNLLAKDNMEISSIESSDKNTQKNSSMKNNIKIEKDIFFGEKEREFINDTNKDSLVSVLNEFYKIYK